VDSAITVLNDMGENVKSYKEILLSGPQRPTALNDMENFIKSCNEVLLSDTRSPSALPPLLALEFPVTPSAVLDRCTATTIVSLSMDTPPAPRVQMSEPFQVTEDLQQSTPSLFPIPFPQVSPVRCAHTELRRSTRIAARTTACGGRRFYSNKLQIVE